MFGIYSKFRLCSNYFCNKNYTISCFTILTWIRANFAVRGPSSFMTPKQGFLPWMCHYKSNTEIALFLLKSSYLHQTWIRQTENIYSNDDQGSVYQNSSFNIPPGQRFLYWSVAEYFQINHVVKMQYLFSLYFLHSRAWIRQIKIIIMTSKERFAKNCKFIDPTGKGSCARRGLKLCIILMTCITLVVIVLRGYNAAFFCHCGFFTRWC